MRVLVKQLKKNLKDIKILFVGGTFTSKRYLFHQQEAPIPPARGPYSTSKRPLFHQQQAPIPQGEVLPEKFGGGV